jgi:outer membrane protein assembly factor BamD (BamD/ComL family)
MNKTLLVLALSILITFVSTASAQRNVSPALDPIMEADAKHNLDVAWQAFGPNRQAYKQVLLRFEETSAAYPEFSGMGTFLYLAGMSSYYLSENKGKQKVDPKSAKEKVKFAPEKLKEDATMYLSMVVDKYPDSQYKAEAEKTLALLKGRKSEK